MNTFLENLEDDFDNTFYNAEEFGQTITYDNGTTQTQVSAIVDYGVDGQKHEGIHATIQVKKLEVVDPVYGDSFIIDSVVYKINNDSGQDFRKTLDPYTWEIKTTAKERGKGWR